MQRFGEKLRTLRTQRGMTLRELAEALGYVSYSYLGLLETGKKKPTAELVMKVAQLFQVTTDQLLWDHLDVDATNSAGRDE
jgi:transcriptional regulator with XRE-family HTH domain